MPVTATAIVAETDASVVMASGGISVIAEMFGTEGPGTGVDCVTAVTARVCVDETVVVMALELVEVMFSPWVFSGSP